MVRRWYIDGTLLSGLYRKVSCLALLKARVGLKTCCGPLLFGVLFNRDFKVMDDLEGLGINMSWLKEWHRAKYIADLHFIE